MASTLAQKILLAPTEAVDVSVGEIVMVRRDVVMTNDISGPTAFKAMERMGPERVFDPAHVVVVSDHYVPAKDERSAELQKLLEHSPRVRGTRGRSADDRRAACGREHGRAGGRRDGPLPGRRHALPPRVALPHSPGNVVPLEEASG